MTTTTPKSLDDLRAAKAKLESESAKSKAASELAASKAARIAELVAKIEGAVADYTTARDEKKELLARLPARTEELRMSLECHIGKACRDELDKAIGDYATKLKLDNPDSYAGHSLRAGLITAAAEAGRDAAEIMETSLHKTPKIVMEYIRSVTKIKRAASRGLL